MTQPRRTVKDLGENALGVADHPLTLVLLPGTFAVCRLDPSEAFPSWAAGGEPCVRATLSGRCRR